MSLKRPHRAREKEHNINVIPENATTFETHAKYQIRYSDVLVLVNFIGSSEQYKGHMNSNHLWAEIVFFTVGGFDLICHWRTGKSDSGKLTSRSGVEAIVYKFISCL